MLQALLLLAAALLEAGRSRRPFRVPASSARGVAQGQQRVFVCGNPTAAPLLSAAPRSPILCALYGACAHGPASPVQARIIPEFAPGLAVAGGRRGGVSNLKQRAADPHLQHIMKGQLNCHP
jgi:hypothetical protein